MLTLCVSLLSQITARFIRAVVVSRVVSSAALYGRNRVFHTHSSAVLGSSLHALILPAAWRQVSSISIHLLTREFTLLEICMIYHQAEQVSQQGSLISLARVRNESSARCLCSARVNLSCWQVESVMSESTGSRSKMICSEMFVFCSGLLVSLAFES